MVQGTGARVGVLAVGLAAYWPQFDGIRERVLAHFAAILAKFEGQHEIVDKGLVDTIEAARAAAQAFRARDVDVVFCHLTTYATSEPLMIAVRDLDVPIILLNVQSVPTLDVSKTKEIGDWLGAAISCAALPEMTNTLMRAGKRIGIVTGYLHGDASVDAEMATWCRTASIRRVLREASLGLLGRPYPGMMDLAVDETALFADFGVYVKHVNWDDVADELDSISDDLLKRRLAAISETFDIPAELGEDVLRSAARVLCAFDRLIKKEGLCGLANHYEGAVASRHVEILAASNAAFSILIREGVACPVEGDLKVALAMVALKRLAGAATLAELYSMDFRDDLVILGHSGAVDPGIGTRKPRLKLSTVFHGKSGGGFLTQTYPEPGPLTLMSLAQRPDGKFRLIAAEGEVVAGPAMELGDTNCRVRFGLGLRGFVNAWAETGPTHHAVMAKGRHASDIERLARLFGLEAIIVCR
jgi:L-arabinose isomerase